MFPNAFDMLPNYFPVRPNVLKRSPFSPTFSQSFPHILPGKISAMVRDGLVQDNGANIHHRFQARVGERQPGQASQCVHARELMGILLIFMGYFMQQEPIKIGGTYGIAEKSGLCLWEYPHKK